MKKILVLGLTALLTTASLFGQEKGSALGIDVEVNEYKTGRGTKNFGTINGKQYAQGKSGFVFYFFPIAMHTLLNKKEDGQVLKTVKLEDKNKYFKRKKFEVTNFVTVGENIVELVPRYDEKNSTYTIYAEAFNQNLNSVELGEIYTTKFKEGARFLLSYEKYESKLLLKISKYESGALKSISYLFVDQNLETEDIIVINTDEDGTFTGATTYVSSDEPDITYAISTTKGDEELEGVCYQLDLEKGRDTDFDLDFSDLDEKKSNIVAKVHNNKLYIFGFSKVEKGDQILDEYFTQIYDINTKKLISHTTNELSPEFIIEPEIDAFKSTHQKAIDKGEYKSLRTHRIIQTHFLENGNILQLATNFSMNTMQNIFVYLLDEKGEIIKKTSFQVRQYTGYSAFGVHNNLEGDILKLCYLDREGLQARTIDITSLKTESELLLETKKIIGYDYFMTTTHYPKHNERVIQGTKLSKEQSIHITF